MKKIEFKSPREFVLWLLDHQGKILADDYGRQWMFENYTFRFKDIGLFDTFENSLRCVHLFGSNLYILKEKE